MKSYLLALALLFSINLSAQFDLSGTVLDMDGNPAIGLSIALSQDNMSTITDDKGNFSFGALTPGNYTVSVFNETGELSAEKYVRLFKDVDLNIELNAQSYQIDLVEILANRLDENDVYSYIQMDKEDIEVKNLAQDVPYLLQHTPSVVVSSDAGAGVGYTYMRIRGSDASRINVTINGVPLNDSEGQGVFWVDLPDFGSSVDNVQIQRGVGPSTNGAGSFGGTVALNSSTFSSEPYTRLSGTYGSFNTWKSSIGFGSGLLANNFSLDGRISVIKSDGYVDRASSDLRSWYFSGLYMGDKQSLRLNAFSGKERTYQSWWGVPEAVLTENQEDLLTHYYNNLGSIYNTPQDSLSLFNSGRQYNYYTYEDQVDDYKQTHFQLIHSFQANPALNLSTTLHYTKGKGFFEEFKYQDDLADYLLESIDNGDGTFTESTDIIRRRFLDNDFVGGIVNAKYDLSYNTQFLFGTSYNKYFGDHFGNVVSADGLLFIDSNRDYYFSSGDKSDFNVYAKVEQHFGEKLSLTGDLQYRIVQYQASGTDNDLLDFIIDAKYNFFNPKFGVNYALSLKNQLYFSYARAQREPVRSDFVDARGNVPNAEKLNDFEFGFRHRSAKANLEINLYHMDYKDQLVVTGAVNDVGAAVRQNVDKSFRQGIEIVSNFRVGANFEIGPYVTLSNNKIETFEEIVLDYTNGFDVVTNQFEDTNLAFSPSVIAGNILTWKPIKNGSITLLSKYIGDQYLDNTSNETRQIDAYLINDVVLSYDLKSTFAKNVGLKLAINNIFNEKYSANGYTYSYIFGDLISENFYYPQAGTNFLFGLTFDF